MWNLLVIVLLLFSTPVWAVTPKSVTDGAGGVWSITADTTIFRNGVPTGGGLATDLMIVDGKIQVTGMDGQPWHIGPACSTCWVPGPVIVTAPAPCGVNPISAKSGNWSDPTTWAGCIPKDTDHATVTAGHVVVVDGPVSVTEVLVRGQLSACRLRSSTLLVGSVVVFPGGIFDWGTPTSPIPANVTATVKLVDIPGAVYTHLHGQPGLEPVLHAHGGRIEMQGTGPTVPWTTLTANAAAGSSTLALSDVAGWKAGDAIVIGGTVKLKDNPVCPFPNCIGDPASMQSEERTIASVNLTAKTVMLTTPLTFAHGGIVSSASCRTCRQAVVGNLTRNVTVASANPAGRRGHVHFATDVLDSSAGSHPVIHISDAAFVSLGRPEAGAYGGPHLHMLGKASDAYVKRSVIRDSANVWVRLHGTHMVTVADNIGYRSIGNGFSTEDGTEAYNVFDHNLGVQAAPAATNTNPNDLFDGGEGAAFWANTPRNIYTRNVAVENTWGFQIQRGNRLAMGEPIPVLSVDATGTPTIVDLQAAPLLRVDNNVATGSLIVGFEMAGGRSMQESLVDHMYAVDNKSANVSLLTENIVFDHAYLAHGGEGELSNPQFQLQDISSYLGQTNLTFRNSYVSAVHVGYQTVGYLHFENVQVDWLLRSALGLTDTIISLSGPTAATGGFPYGVHLGATPIKPTTTGNLDMILWHYDGPGQHVMLRQNGTVPVDGLTYAPSTRFAHGTDMPWQEARFTGPYGQGPDFAWPLRIDAGNQVILVPGEPGRIPPNTDLLVDGKRWRVDVRYVPSPPGMRLARYGYQTTSHLDGSLANPLAEGTRFYNYDQGLLESYRSGTWQFRYTVDLPNGAYWVDLGWKEDMPGPNAREMAVDANGVTKIAHLDVFAEVGLNTPLWKSFGASVTNERLILEFRHLNGYPPSIGAIAVCPVAMVVNGRCP